jgi:hypothetical protein
MAEPSFFTEMKKGEVNELRAQLRTSASEKDPQKLRGVVQKVISYMTLGIDMSPLFTDMVMVCASLCVACVECVGYASPCVLSLLVIVCATYLRARGACARACVVCVCGVVRT